MKNKYLPLTIQNAKTFKAIKKVDETNTISIGKFQSNKISPYGLYKPISKLLED